MEIAWAISSSDDEKCWVIIQNARGKVDKTGGAAYLLAVVSPSFDVL